MKKWACVLPRFPLMKRARRFSKMQAIATVRSNSGNGVNAGIGDCLMHYSGFSSISLGKTKYFLVCHAILTLIS